MSRYEVTLRAKVNGRPMDLTITAQAAGPVAALARALNQAQIENPSVSSWKKIQVKEVER